MLRQDAGNPLSERPVVIAIDGPAGAGKSTVTRRVAERLGLLFLDTGAMYRAATLRVLASDIDRDDSQAVAGLVRDLDIGFDEQGRVAIAGEVLDEASLRASQTTGEVWRVADNPACREHLVAVQRMIVAGRGAAVEGRDATTVICPDATLKIYLDASVEERTRRRIADWQARGQVHPPVEEVRRDIEARDHRDRSRSVGALALADDAVPVISDGLAPEEVVCRICALAVQRRPLLLERRLAGQLLVGRSRQPGYVRVAQGSINDPPAPWQLGLTNPSADRLPDTTRDLTRNHGGRQAGVLCQGRAVLVFAGTGPEPGEVVALPMLPQSWYVIEPEVWHAVIQQPGTICAWAEASAIREERRELGPLHQAELRGFLEIYLPPA